MADNDKWELPNDPVTNFWYNRHMRDGARRYIGKWLYNNYKFNNLDKVGEDYTYEQFLEHFPITDHVFDDYEFWAERTYDCKLILKETMSETDYNKLLTTKDE